MAASNPHTRPSRAVAVSGILLLANLAVLLGAAAPAAAQSSATPSIIDIAYVDTDQNGLLDGVVVEVSEPVYAPSIRPGDFHFRSSFTSFGTLDDERFGHGHFDVPAVAADVLSCSSVVDTTATTVPEPVASQQITFDASDLDPTGDAFEKTGHGLQDGDAIVLSTDDTLPAELDALTVYFVVNAQADSFQLATAAGGTPVAFSTQGTGPHQVNTGYGACFGISFKEHPFWSTGGVLGSFRQSSSELVFPDMAFTPRILHTAFWRIVIGPDDEPHRGDNVFLGSEAKDAAPPVLLAASAVSGDNDIVAIYSEQLSNQATPPNADEVYDYEHWGAPGQATPIQAEAVAYVADSRAVEISLATETDVHDLQHDNNPEGADNLTTLSQTATLKDKNGLDEVGQRLPLTPPRIVSAIADLENPSKVLLTFNMPVQSVVPSSSASTQLSAADFHNMQTGPQGNTLAVDKVEHRLGSATAVLTVTPPLARGDLSEHDPTRVVVRGDRITALGHLENRMDSLDHDEDGQPDYSGTQPIVASIEPRIEAAVARDLDQDGLLDVIEVKFTKPIRDGTPPTGGGASQDTSNLKATDWRIVVNQRGADGGADLVGTIPDFTILSKGGDNVPACSIDQALGGKPDDETIYLCWQQGSIDPATLECTGYCIGTGDQLSLDYTPPGDPVAAQVKDDSENLLPAYRGFAARDAARPIILGAITRDMDENGRIDGYEIWFSEAMDAREQPQVGWQVEGRALPNDAMGGFTGSRVWFLEFEEIENGYDTGVTPNLEYTAGSKPWRDFYGNNLGSLSRSAITEVDGAAPKLVRIEGEEGSRFITFLFSEGVVSHPSNGSIEPSSLQYLNEGPGDASAPMPGTFQHTPGSTQATWRLNEPITQPDLATGSQDKVRVREASVDLISCQDSDCSNIKESSSAATAPKTVEPKDYRLVAKKTQAQDDDRPDDPRNLKLAVTAGDNPTHTSVVVQFDESFDEVGPVSYRLAYAESVIDTTAKFTAATKATVTSAPVENGKVTLTATGLPENKTLYLAVRARDSAQPNPNDSNGIAFMDTAIKTKTKPVLDSDPDHDPPAAISSLEVTDVKANSVVLSFPKPNDPGNPAKAGIGGYMVKVSDSSFSGFAAGCTSNTTCPHDKLGGITVDQPLTTGDQVTMRIGGLDQETEYFFAVKAYDLSKNIGGPSPVVSAETGKDTTKPPAPTGLTLTPETGIVEFTPVTVSWEAVIDEDSDVTQYHYAVNDDEAYVITDADDVVEEETVLLSNLAEGKNYFHVAAVSAGGLGATARVLIDVNPAPPELEDTQIKTANGAITESVERDGDNVFVSWTLPADPPATLAGVQIWCIGADGTSGLLQTVESGTGPFRAKRWADQGGTCAAEGGSYMVTGFYEGGVGQSSEGNADTLVTDVQSDSTPLADDSGPLPLWLLLALIGTAVLVLVVILVLVLRRKGGGGTQQVWQDEADAGDDMGSQWSNVQAPEAAESAQPYEEGAPEPAWAEESPAAEAEEPAWADEGGDEAEEPAWADEGAVDAGAAAGAGAAAPPATEQPFAEQDPDADAEVHQVTCPECQDVFVAEGRRPLRIECPSCGVEGTL